VRDKRLSKDGPGGRPVTRDSRRKAM